MKKHSNSMLFQNFTTAKRHPFSWVMLPAALIVAGMIAGCETQPVSPTNALNGQAANTNELAAASEALSVQTNEPVANTSDLVNLREGDVLKISFPGSPTLDTTQPIRRDGKITLPLVGEVDAAGMPPSTLESKLVDLYAPQLSSKQVTVEVVSSSFPVYVTGMVLRPGEILSDHPITALEAVMEAGGFDYTKANAKNVVVIRREGNIMKNYRLNLKAVLQGEQSEPFYLKPDDIVYVPERFSMF
jgi:polysaccharide export outer membrane protein